MLIHKLPEELLEYQKLARDFASRQMRKVSHGAESSDFPLELIKAAWESGLLNMSVPEEFGGLGLGALENCVIAEELAWGEAGIAGSIEGSEIAQCFVLTCGTKEQQAEFLSPPCGRPVSGWLWHGQRCQKQSFVLSQGRR
ncbi:MAG: acyl-CoA dehydrogenase family protein [Candidatus Obscuribacter sp.]|nr:acyl-CoA dehydrogenase family protein [Candidatus Obscuribacter sp.]